MHILQAYHDWNVGQQSGIPSVMQHLISELESRHELSVLMEDWTSPSVTETLDQHGRPFHKLRLMPPPARITDIPALIAWPFRLMIGAWRLRGLCRRLGVDVIHVHYPAARHLSMRVARALGGPPYLITCHRGDVLQYPHLPWLHRAAMRWAMRGADAVTAVSGWLARAATEAVDLEPEAVCIFNGYTATPSALLERSALVGKLELPLPDRFAVMVANCYAYKGHDIALVAWQRIACEAPDFILIAIGGGPGLEACRAAAREAGVADHVWLLGPQPREVALGLIAAADLLVAPSRNEGQGMVLLEAAALGTPVVCSNIPPFLELVTDGDTAHVFPSEDSIAMAAAVLGAIDDTEGSAAMARRLQYVVETRFSVAAMASEYEKLYTRLSRNPQFVPAARG